MTNTLSPVEGPRGLPGPEEKPILRPSEVAWYLRWSKNTVLSLIHSGELAAIKVGNRYFIPNTELRRYLRLPSP